MSRFLGELTWPDIAHHGADTVLLIPVGSTEQHGPHLPLDTDTRIARALAVAAAAQRDNIVVAPAVPFGASGEHAGFPGTVSIGTEALTQVLVEIARSTSSSYQAVVFVNGHGGNADALRRAQEIIDHEGHSVGVFTPSFDGGDAHAGRTETSILLAIAPDAVHLDAAEAGNTEPLAQLLPKLRADGVATHAPNGVLGDPTGADEQEGWTLMNAAVTQLLTAVNAVVDAATLTPDGEASME